MVPPATMPAPSLPSTEPAVPQGAAPRTYQESQRPSNGGAESNGVPQPTPQNGAQQNYLVPEPQESSTRSTNGWQLRLPQRLDSHDRVTANAAAPGNMPWPAARTHETLRTVSTPLATAAELLDADGWRPARTRPQ
jgi:hypothetical protein